MQPETTRPENEVQKEEKVQETEVDRPASDAAVAPTVGDYEREQRAHFDRRLNPPNRTLGGGLGEPTRPAVAQQPSEAPETTEPESDKQ